MEKVRNDFWDNKLSLFEEESCKEILVQVTHGLTKTIDIVYCLRYNI